MSRGTGRSRRGATENATLSLFGEVSPPVAPVAELPVVETAERTVELAVEPVSTAAPVIVEDEPARETADVWLARAFAGQMRALAVIAGAPPESVRAIETAARAVSLATSAGHACVDIGTLGGDFVLTRAALLGSKLVDTTASAASRPFVLDAQGRLYLYRYFDYERRIARRLAAMRPRPMAFDGRARLTTRLAELFPGEPSRAADDLDRQKLAVALAALNELTVISGGPGTGKTTTVLNILACLVDLAPQARIALAAPTGKAATRMQDAIRERASALSEAVRSRLPQEAFTIHRLLGGLPGSNAFRHDRDHPLAIDVLIVDEASMLDLALAAKLFEAVPSGARIILLGDKDQLAAVESGAVFSELSREAGASDEGLRRLAEVGVDARGAASAAGDAEPALADAVVWLTRNYRFGASSGIGRLAQEIRTGEPRRALDTLANTDDPALRWIDDGGYELRTETIEELRAGYGAYVTALLEDVVERDAVFEAFEGFRVLCAERGGARGVHQINALAEKSVAAVSDARWRRVAHSPWYAGRPVMVLRNDNVLRVFNGDVGIALPGAEGEMIVHFRQGDGSYREIPAVRLPEHETAFATTVHKAQGSEFEDVAIVLPSNISRVVTRELLYTAVTRARRRAAIVATAEIVCAAIDSPMVRHSGLLARLRDEARLGKRD